MYSEYFNYEDKKIEFKEVGAILKKFLPFIQKKTFSQYYSIDDGLVVKTYHSIEDFKSNYNENYKWLSILLKDGKRSSLKFETREKIITVGLTLVDQNTVREFRAFLEKDLGFKVYKFDISKYSGFINQTRRYVKKEISLGLVGKIRDKFFETLKKESAVNTSNFFERFSVTKWESTDLYFNFEKFSHNISAQYLEFKYECEHGKSKIPFLVVHIGSFWIEITVGLDEKYISTLFDDIVEILDITPISSVLIPRSVFIGFKFGGWEEELASRIGYFLTLLNFDVKTGKAFSPEPIEDKLKKRIESQGIFIGIISSDLGSKDKEIVSSNWLLQEPLLALLKNKRVFVIKEEGIDVNLGFLTNIEHIKLDRNKLDKLFINILEGLRELGFPL